MCVMCKMILCIDVTWCHVVMLVLVSVVRGGIGLV